MKDRKVIKVLTILLSLLTIVFAICSMYKRFNNSFNIFTQISLCLLMLVRGMEIIIYQKQNVKGYLYLGISVLLMIVSVLCYSTYFA